VKHVCILVVLFLFLSSLQNKYASLDHGEIQITTSKDVSMLHAYKFKFVNTSNKILEFHYFFKYTSGDKVGKWSDGRGGEPLAPGQVGVGQCINCDGEITMFIREKGSNEKFPFNTQIDEWKEKDAQIHDKH
jgi:hypothetical protein